MLQRPVGGKGVENTGVFEFKHIKHKKEMIAWEFLRCCAAASLFDFYSHCIIV